jgi:putative flippase GtrA
MTTGELTGDEESCAPALTRTAATIRRLSDWLSTRLARLPVGEIAAFALVGSLGVLVDSAIFNVLFSQGQVMAKAMSTTGAMVFTYWGNRNWSFAQRSKAAVRGRVRRFVTINVIALCFSVAFVALCAYPMHMKGLPVRMNLANLTTIALGTVFRFWAYRRYVFPTRSTDATLA